MAAYGKRTGGESVTADASHRPRSSSILMSSQRGMNGEASPMADSWIHVQTRYIPPSESSLPPLAVRTTILVDTYMVWAGATDQPPEEVENAPSQGFLARDWACAMPPRDVSIDACMIRLRCL